MSRLSVWRYYPCQVISWLWNISSRYTPYTGEPGVEILTNALWLPFIQRLPSSEHRP
ncbi:hypothetical protein I7I48_01235 [Histoplasma ohiense]|nr:hypothetical protein I7I48_01235 [Histoplasma ohiense (nom. inval.)]